MAPSAPAGSTLLPVCSWHPACCTSNLAVPLLLLQADKEREYYLGHSVKALTGRCAAAGMLSRCSFCRRSHVRHGATHAGPQLWQGRHCVNPRATRFVPCRWQKGRDVYWYTRDVDRGEADAANELALVKQREADLMAEVRQLLLEALQLGGVGWLSGGLP